jgi:branched-chain amino acid transport system permease protein
MSTLFLIQFLNGLQLGVLLFLLAAGLTLVFGIMDFVNLAHGSLYMLGAFFCATLTFLTGSFLLAIPLALVATAIVGLVVETGVIRHLYQRDHLDHVLATFGFILIADTLVQLIWGPEGIAIPLPEVLQGQVNILPGVIFPTFRLVIIAAGLLVALGLVPADQPHPAGHADPGRRVQPHDGLGAGHRHQDAVLGGFRAGRSAGGLAGMLIAPITEATIGMGNDIIITAFVVIIVGGIGSMKGAFMAALLIGLIDTLGRSFLDDILKVFIPVNAAETAGPAISSMLIYIIMAAVLAFRPQGLFPPKVR